jgi:hypothetical protein
MEEWREYKKVETRPVPESEVMKERKTPRAAHVINLNYHLPPPPANMDGKLQTLAMKEKHARDPTYPTLSPSSCFSLPPHSPTPIPLFPPPHPPPVVFLKLVA